jgi:hypothetical protein
MASDVEIQTRARELYRAAGEPEGDPWRFIGGVAQAPYLATAKAQLSWDVNGGVDVDYDKP